MSDSTATPTLYASPEAPLERILDIGGSVLFEDDEGLSRDAIRNAGPFGYQTDHGHEVPYARVLSVIPPTEDFSEVRP